MGWICKKMKWKIAALLVLLTVIMVRTGLLINQRSHLPKVELGVTDLSGVLKTTTVEKINEQAFDLHEKFGDDMLFITVPNLKKYGGADDFIAAIRKAWSKQAKYPENDLVIVFETGDRKTGGASKGNVHLYMGEGLILVFPMNELSDLLDRTMVPLVERGLINEAFLKMADYLYSRLFQIGQQQQEIEDKVRQVIKKQQTKSAKRQQLFNFVVAMGLLVGIFMIAHVAVGEPCPECGASLDAVTEILNKPVGAKHGLGRKLKSCSYCGYYDMRRFLIHETRRDGRSHRVTKRDWKHKTNT